MFCWLLEIMRFSCGEVQNKIQVSYLTKKISHIVNLLCRNKQYRFYLYVSDNLDPT